ncbi:MAG: RNA polymerase factor sigma-32 [Bauldia sp.]|nr:RNA polymerase factor sigma-32 [Bauldia sp.]
MAGNAAGIRELVAAAAAAPYLERDEEVALAERWRNKRDREALHRLTAAHMRYVIAIAVRFRGFGLPLADTVQEGYVGLMEAAARFDTAHGVRFATYAGWWIRAAIQDYVLRNWSIVRGGTSSSQKALFFNMRRLRARLLSGTGGDLGDSELHRRIGDALGVSASDVAWMDARLSAPDQSLNAPLGQSEGAAEVEDFLVDQETPLPEELVQTRIDGKRRHDWLTEAMSVLSDRERRIVRERRLAESGATLESLGETLGISKERVRQIENRALNKLRDALLETQPDRAAFV